MGSGEVLRADILMVQNHKKIQSLIPIQLKQTKWVTRKLCTYQRYGQVTFQNFT